MGKYEAAFSRLGEEALAKLEGPGGLLAVTQTHLVFVDEAGIRRLELARIRRVGKGEAGTLLVQGEGDSLSLPLKAFPLEELKAFLEELKPHVARARKATSARAPVPRAPLTQEVAPPPPPEPPKAPVWEEEPPAKRDSVELAPEPEPPSPAPTPKAPGGRNPLALPLRLLSLLTLGYTVAFVALNPGGDPWVLAGVLLGGLGLALTEWAASTFSTSSR